MKIFLSWSGAHSRAIAEALNDWLKRVIQAVKPFYSPEIEKGAKWSSELDAALEGTRFGIICLTPDNLNSTWIHYEAGALSKTPDALIWTFLHGLNPGDVPQPLGKYQHTIAEKDDVFKMLFSINKRLADVGGEPIDGAVLAENFELYWPKLEEKLKTAEKPPGIAQTKRSEREILLEILEAVRTQKRSIKSDTTLPALENSGRVSRIRLPSYDDISAESRTRIYEMLIEILSPIHKVRKEDLETGEIDFIFDPPLAEEYMTRLIFHLGEQVDLRLKAIRTGSAVIAYLAIDKPA